MSLRGMAVAPLRVQRGQVIGTLAISYREPYEIPDESLELLQGLADQAAIAVTNARLYAELRQSEARYRYLLTNAPDVAWSIDERGHFTFMSEALGTYHRLEGGRGARPALLVRGAPGVPARPGGRIRAHLEDPFPTQDLRFQLRDREGRPIPADLRAVGDGRRRSLPRCARPCPRPARAGAHGSRPAAPGGRARRRARNARTSPGSCTTRSPRRSSA